MQATGRARKTWRGRPTAVGTLGVGLIACALAFCGCSATTEYRIHVVSPAVRPVDALLAQLRMERVELIHVRGVSAQSPQVRELDRRIAAFIWHRSQLDIENLESERRDLIRRGYAPNTSDVLALDQKIQALREVGPP